MLRKLKRFYPFNTEQTVNILSEFGPLITMFVVNAAAGINAGTWALLVTTVIAMVVMRKVLGRLPVFPQIASSVTITFGALTLITNDPMWVQIKVTIFNALFALFLFAGLYFKKNFFKYVFDKTFHYTQKGWDSFTKSFAWFFIFTAVVNELVRQGFPAEETFDLLGYKIDGVNVWILFKILIIMPVTGVYAWYLTRVMQKHRLPDHEADAELAEAHGGTGTARRTGAQEFAEAGALKPATTVVRSTPVE
jgi:intracellular septation protein